MNKTLIEMQVFTEIAMSIGNNLDLGQMASVTLSAYLRKLSCSTGMVLQAISDLGGCTRFQPTAKIPRKARPSGALLEALKHIPGEVEEAALTGFYGRLPIVAPVDVNKHCYIMQLPKYGLLLLIKAGTPFDDAAVKSLSRLNLRFAESCIVCRQNEEIASINIELRREIEERRRIEKELHAVLEELESRVVSRTRDLLTINRQLEEALANVKTLSGLLPICSVCKKVRDDQGYWGQIESYISNHSGAMFTHGLCPECTKKVYPDIELPPEP